MLTNRGIIEDQDQTTSILQEIKDCVETELQIHCGKSSNDNSAAPVNHKTVRTVYIDGQNSIVNNLPIPSVSIFNKAAYIPAREIINHILAMGIDVILSMLVMKKTGLINPVVMKQIFFLIFIKIFQS